MDPCAIPKSWELSIDCPWERRRGRLPRSMTVDSRPFTRRGCPVGQKPRRNSVNPRGDGRFGSSTTLSHSASVLEAACPLEGFLRLGERSGQPELITKRHSAAYPSTWVIH